MNGSPSSPATVPGSLPMSTWAQTRMARGLYIFSRLLEKLSFGRVVLRIYFFCMQPINKSALEKIRDDPQTVVQPVSPGEVLTDNFPRPPAVINERFERGSTCYAAVVKGRFAGYIWLANTQFEEDEVRCKYVLPSDGQVVWDFDVYVEPNYRGGRTLGRLWKGVNSALYTRGVQWTASRISLFNPSSLQTHERLGAIQVATGMFLLVGAMQLSLFSKAPYIHLGFGRKQGPVFKLPPPVRAAGQKTLGAAALVLGLDSHGLAAVRALGDAGVTVYAVESNMSQPGTATPSVARTFHAQHFNPEHLMKALPEIRQQMSAHSEVVLIAINDRHVKTIGNHLEQLLPLYKIAWAHCAEKVLKLQQKDSLESWSVRQGLNYPRSVIFFETTQIKDAVNLQYPVIIKPVQPLSSFKTLLARDVSELEQLLLSHAHDLPILGQEYIAGDDEAIFFGALMLDRGKVLYGMCGRKIASYPPARGQTTIAETIENAEVLRLTEQFFQGLEISGPVSLELKRDPQGRYWVIEPTVGRTDFWVQLCISAGFNQPLMEFQLATKQAVTLPTLPAREFVWYDTERDPLAYISLCWREKSIRPRGKRQVFTYLRLKGFQVFLKAEMQLIYKLVQKFISSKR